GFRKPLHERILHEARSKREMMDLSH
ncbi:hypothetical protein ACOUA9_16510, partial [Acinetobacter baumannii]